MGRQIEDSWFAEYLRYTEGQESPDLFHIFVAASIISAVLNRDVKMDRKLFQLYPNLYVILVAGTSKCHKSKAIEIGTDIMAKTKNSPRKFAQKLTNERLIQFLGENVEIEGSEGIVRQKASGLIAADELSSFLGANAMETGIITTLTDLYGCQNEWSYETKSSGKDILKNVYVTFLGASTAKWLRSAIPEEAVGGGFISRCIFLYQNEPKRLIPWPEDEVPENLNVIEERLVHDLEHIASLKGKFDITKEAKDWYTEWYKENAERIDQLANPDFFTRWHVFILKLGMIISVSRTDELMITLSDLQLADQYLQSVENNMTMVLDTLTTKRSELPTGEVLGIIRRRHEVTHESLMNMTRRTVNVEGLQVIVETLAEAGQIEIHLSPDEPKKYIYVGDD